MKIIKVVLIICFINISLAGFADGDVQDEKQSFVPGFIFNTNNILLDLDSYQGGLGLKFLFEDFAFRGSLGGAYQSAAEVLKLTGSLVFERSFLEGRVVPYSGVEVKLDYIQEQSTDGDDWTKVSSFMGGLGGILGAELFIFDYLSLFAEYKLSCNIVRSKVTENVEGEETLTTSNNYEIATGLGNSASIGVVLYFKPVFNID